MRNETRALKDKEVRQVVAERNCVSEVLAGTGVGG